jgi:UDP-4-amino-4,6-dideoxy-N-acetyl-beta-L-altrosamine transaminase
MIPYGRQDVTQADIDSVIDVLKSDLLTQGPIVPQFEGAVARYCGARHAVAVNSATSALHIACLALKLGPGDLLWTSPITFVASANCARYCGADIDFVDIDPRTYNMSPAALETKLEVAKAIGRLPKIVVPVHLTGQSCDMRAIGDLARHYGFQIIEDASHAVGGRYEGRAVGSCVHSDIAVFSFHPVKIITTAEGGMAVTNSADLAHRLRLFRSHGITRDGTEMTHEPDGGWYYQQIALGYNYRLTELQAALGLSQLDRIDEYVAHRARLAARYGELLARLPLTLPYQAQYAANAWHLYVVRLKLDEARITHRQFYDRLREAGIGVNLHYIPVHTQPYYRALPGGAAMSFPEAERYYSEAVSLPMFATLTEADQDQVVAAIEKILA